MPATTLEALLKRDRIIVLCGLVVVSALAWVYLIHEASGMNSMNTMDMNMPMNMDMEMAMPQMQAWRTLDLFLIFTMWAVMMVAMMVPTTTPMLLLFATTNRKRREQRRP